MPESRVSRNSLIALLLLYAVARVLQLFPEQVPTLLIVVLHVLPPSVFAAIHGRRIYGVRGILVFFALCLGVGSFCESLSLRTGFPFGNYYFTAVMGPKIFSLPILLALAYVGVGYLAWIVATLMVGARQGSRAALLAVPLVAALAMCAWDLAMDPVWVNIDRAWVWRDGGAWFGVPLTNYFGWFLTTWVFYQAFAFWLRGRRSVRSVSRGWLRKAVLFYGMVAAGNLLLAFPSAVPASFPKWTFDAMGRRWLTADLNGACILISLFVMAPFALLAWEGASGYGRSPGAEAYSRAELERVIVVQ